MKTMGVMGNSLLFVGILILFLILFQIKRYIFSRMRAQKGDLMLLFYERVTTFIMVVIAVLTALSVFGGFSFMWKSLLGGTAFVSAIIAFMAQDVVKDILAGMMISIYKPFELGNRVELEDGTAGIVEDITMRHIVLKGADTVRIIIPNRRLEDMKIRNFSYHLDCRSVQLNFCIAYPTDVEFAIKVIRRAIMESPYSIPGKPTKDGMEYAPVYFMAFEDSSLRLMTTVYFESSTPSEVLITDINLQVDRALWANNIEIPYPHLNVIQTENEEKVYRTEVVPELRWKTPMIIVSADGAEIPEAMDVTAELGQENGLNVKEILRLRLLSEELLRMMPSIVGNVDAKYWVEDKNNEFRLHLSANVTMTRETRKKLLSLSSTGKNAADQTLADKIQEMIYVMMLPGAKKTDTQSKELLMEGEDLEENKDVDSYMWSMKQHKNKKENGEDNTENTVDAWDEIEKSIIASIADDISISIRGTRVEIIVYKTF